MKIPARRAEYSLTENVASPFQAEPRHGARSFVTPRANKLTVADLVEALRGDFELRGKLSKQNGGHLARSAWNRIFKAIAEEAELPPEKRHCHVLKHSLANHLIRGNVNLALVNQSLGHANIQSTMWYLGVTDAEAGGDGVAGYFLTRVLDQFGTTLQRMGQRQFSESAKSLSSKGIMEPRARVELATCRLRIAFNLNEPKPPNVILSIVRNLRFGGFGVFRLIFDGLMEL